MPIILVFKSTYVLSKHPTLQLLCSVALQPSLIGHHLPEIADLGGQVSVLSPDNRHQYPVMCLDTQWQMITLFMVDFAYFTIDNSTILVFR